MARFVIVLVSCLVLIWGCEEKTSTSGVAQDSKTYTAADVDDALTQARNFRLEGKYSEALERHLWYHKNALKYAPAQYGVRLSFALSDWAELGKAYPKALETLREVRDETLAGYRKNPSDEALHSEVLSINLALDDLDAARSLFYEGRKAGVKSNLKLLIYLDRVLAKDKQWAEDVVGDPDEKMAGIEGFRKTLLESFKQQEKPERYAHLPNETFIRQSLTLIRAVEMLKGKAEARKIQKRALKTVNSPKIRDALKG